MDKLSKLASLCNGSVEININIHRVLYESVETYFRSIECYNKLIEEIGLDIYEKMKELDTIVDLQFYPSTPIGSYTIYHYSIDKALDKALSIMEKHYGSKK